MLTFGVLLLVTFFSSDVATSFSPALANAHFHAAAFKSRSSEGLSPSHKQRPSSNSRHYVAASSVANEMLHWASSAVVPASRGTKVRPEQTRRSSQSSTLGRNTNQVESEYERRKQEWANRYTNLDSLRDTFGANRNKVWGDLDAATARRLYKTLLPKALLELAKVGVEPQDLAPLAYQARVAAKLYARERCQLPARVGAQLFDGFRNLKRYGKFQTKGMSYQQIWEKYHQIIMEDAEDEGYGDGLTEEDVTAKICLKILERSCCTNEDVDRWVLPPEDEQQHEDLAHITEKLEKDVRKLLLPVESQQQQRVASTAKSLRIQKYKTLRLIARATKRRRSHSMANRKKDPTAAENDQQRNKDTSSSSSSRHEEKSKPWNQRKRLFDRPHRRH